MAKEFKLSMGEGSLRLICPECEAMWSTMECPSECPNCAALVTVRTIRKPQSTQALT